MPQRKRKVFETYRYRPQSALQPGDRFRVQGGPVYITDDGRRFPMYERGVLIFRRYCEQGAKKWIDAYRADNGAAVCLWVGRSIRSAKIPNIRRRPYRITRKLRPDRPSVSRRSRARRDKTTRRTLSTRRTRR